MVPIARAGSGMTPACRLPHHLDLVPRDRESREVQRSAHRHGRVLQIDSGIRYAGREPLAEPVLHVALQLQLAQSNVAPRRPLQDPLQFLLGLDGQLGARLHHHDLVALGQPALDVLTKEPYPQTHEEEEGETTYPCKEASNHSGTTIRCCGTASSRKRLHPLTAIS
jgi:hypothetical protein